MSRHWVNMNYSKPSKAYALSTGVESVSQRDKEKLAVSPVSHFLCVAELHGFWQEAAPLVLFSHRRLKNARSVWGRFTGSCSGRSESVHIEHSRRLIFPRMVPFLAGELHFKVPRELHSLFLFFSHMTGLWQEELTPFALTWLSQNCRHQYFPAAPWAVT